MSGVKTLVLEHSKIEQKLDRMAREVLEKYHRSPKIFIVGIADRGQLVAVKLHAILKNIFAGELLLGAMKMDKHNPIDTKVDTDFEPSKLADAHVVLVDDVLESGKTMIYATRFLLNAPVSSISTAVLVDRMHPRFPIKADFVGLTLSTTLQEHVQVEVGSNGELNAFLV